MRTSEQQDILDALADAAVDIVVLMPDTATIVRPTLTSDAFGGQASADVTVGEVPCRRRQLAARERVAVEGTDRVPTYKVTVPAGTDVRPSDALLVDGLRFEVLSVPRNTYVVQIGCLCAEVPS